MSTHPIQGPEAPSGASGPARAEELRAWAIEQAVQFTKNRDANFDSPTRLAALFVRSVTTGEVPK
jgi:hypothetical protein